MVPPSVDNLLVAGRYFPPPNFVSITIRLFFKQSDFIPLIRCVAGDKTSHCAMRNMMACTVTGQTQIQIQIQRQIQTWNWIHCAMRTTSWLALSQVKGQALLLPSLSRYILKIMKLSHLELSSIQALSQIVIWSAGGGEHPGGGRQEGAGGAGQARSEDTLKVHWTNTNTTTRQMQIQSLN